jgi:hypothetical protein
MENKVKAALAATQETNCSAAPETQVCTNIFRAFLTSSSSLVSGMPVKNSAFLASLVT